MVSQVICVICSKAAELPAQFKSWKNAVIDALSKERPDLLADGSLHDTYVCSRHFTVDDFTFKNGKLGLVENAVPSLLAKSHYENCDAKQPSRITKDYEPSSRGNNFATTLTKDFVTTSRHNFRSDLISTETSRVLTPTVSEYVTTSKRTIDNILSTNIGNLIDSGLDGSKKRIIDVQHKVEIYEKIFKRMRYDNVLTEEYVEKLKEQIPESEEILKTTLANE